MTWKTIPPGEVRAVLGIPTFYKSNRLIKKLDLPRLSPEAQRRRAFAPTPSGIKLGKKPPANFREPTLGVFELLGGRPMREIPSEPPDASFIRRPVPWDYLADEVFSQQPGDMRQFLCQTSILDRFTPSLCQAITGRADCAAILRQVFRSAFIRSARKAFRL